MALRDKVDRLKHFDFPIVPRSYLIGNRTWAAGLYLFVGPRASGKSTLLAGLAEWLIDQRTEAQVAGKPTEYSVSYHYVREPRASVSSGEESQPRNDSRHILDVIKDSSAPGFVIIDSITLLLPIWGMQQLGGLSDVTYPRGVRLSDMLALSELDFRAAEAGNVVIAAMNSDLYPMAEILESLIEGALSVTGTWGTVVMRNRVLRDVEAIQLQKYLPSAPVSEERDRI